MADLYAASDPRGHKWQIKAYRDLANTLKNLRFVVRSSKDVAHIRGAGPKMQRKIDEILQTGVLRKRQTFEETPGLAAARDLMRVHGVGASKARVLVEHGILSVEDLKRRARDDPDGTEDLVGRAPMAYLKHFDDLQSRIPRAEVAQLRDFVANAAREVFPEAAKSGGLVVEAVGSFRRGAESSADVDVLITDAVGRADRALPLLPLLDHLRASGFALEDLSGFDRVETVPFATAATLSPTPSSSSMRGFASRASKRSRTKSNADDDDDDDDDDGADGDLDDDERTNYSENHDDADDETHGGDNLSPTAQTWLGIVRLPPTGLARRMDIKTYPSKDFAFATLYFTGSGVFNRSLREWAHRHDLCLSDRGLFPVKRGSEAKPTKQGTRARCDLTGGSVPCRTERDIFEALGLEYQAPHERNVSGVHPKGGGGNDPAPLLLSLSASGARPAQPSDFSGDTASASASASAGDHQYS